MNMDGLKASIKNTFIMVHLFLHVALSLSLSLLCNSEHLEGYS